MSRPGQDASLEAAQRGLRPARAQPPVITASLTRTSLVNGLFCTPVFARSSLVWTSIGIIAHDRPRFCPHAYRAAVWHSRHNCLREKRCARPWQASNGLRVATKTLEYFVARLRQLYERELGESLSTRLGAYVRRWVRWVSAGFTCVSTALTLCARGGGPVTSPAPAAPHEACVHFPGGAAPTMCTSFTKKVFSVSSTRLPRAPHENLLRY
jgi:hypothetical protein